MNLTLSPCLKTRVHYSLLKDPRSGLFHISGSERVSRYQLLQILCRTFDLPQALVQPISSTQDADADSHPKDVSLVARYSEAVLKQQFTRVAEGLRQMRSREMDG